MNDHGRWIRLSEEELPRYSTMLKNATKQNTSAAGLENVYVNTGRHVCQRCIPQRTSCGQLDLSVNLRARLLMVPQFLVVLRQASVLELRYFDLSKFWSGSDW